MVAILDFMQIQDWVIPRKGQPKVLKNEKTVRGNVLYVILKRTP